MTFTSPLALLLLLVLPYLVWLGRPVTGSRRFREWASLAVRCMVALLLVLGLSGLQVVAAADQLAVAYLVDASDSVPPAEHQKALEWVRSAVESLEPNETAAVVLFGADALVERPLSSVAALAPVTSVPQPLNTDIGAAIRLGLALLPAGAARRLVILSDGDETVGDAAQSARLAVASGVQIDVYPVGGAPETPEVLLTAVSAPSRLAEGDRFELKVTASSNVPTSALLRVLADGVVAYEKRVSLSGGENHFSIPLVAQEQGFARYRVQITPEQDGFYQNNELAAYTEITGPPRILLVSSPPQAGAEAGEFHDEGEQLALALQSAGVAVDRATTTLMPADLPTMASYATIILADVAAKYLGPRKTAALQLYVRDLGGGLVAVGGPESYAPGGYYDTPLEETLPVQMRIQDQERHADLTMIFVVDKSGSMSDTSVGGVPKIELAKEAVIRSLGLLGPLDRAGVVAFDSSAFWALAPQPVADPDSMADQVGAIRASGGTDIYAGLRAVAEVLPEDPATLKHIVLLTDGGASQAGNPELTQEMHDEYGATLSVVAIGEGYAPWIVRLAELGEGRFHFAYDPDTIPEIFAQETTLATRAYIVEERFWPSQVERHAILQGITAAPPLYGYVGTSSKPAAHTILVTHRDDPLLAAWRYGLGKSIAWTSDATARWATEWVEWAGFARFWEQAVKWTITQERGSSAESSVTLEEGRALVTVETAAANGAFLNGLEMEVRVVNPENEPEIIKMQQVAPGRYQGTWRPTGEGAYLLRVAGAGPEASVAQTSGWVLGYSPEYQASDTEHGTLAYLAEMGGGGVLNEPRESLSHDISSGRLRRPIWQWLLLAAALLLPLDVAIRRLVLGRDDARKAWASVQARLSLRRVKPQLPAAPSERVVRLFAAKRRVARPPVSAPGPPEAATVPLEAEPVEPPAPPPPADSSLAGRLLESKRKRSRGNND